MKDINQDLMAPEVLVLLIQNGQTPQSGLEKMSKSILYSAIQKFYLEGYEQDDLLQEGRIVFTKAIKDYQIDKNMKFLDYYQMMLMNHLNKLRRRQEALVRRANTYAYSLEELIEKTGEPIEGLATTDTRPEDVAIVKQSYSQYICDLSDFETLVYVAYLEKKDPEEIAEILGYSVDQIQNALYRCKKKFYNNLS